jgi:leucyl aminopeptidase
MPSSTAYKPGDILTTLSGKTIEVLNTDAEGRIVLADALFYAQRYEPNAIVDLATLTGAIIVALGNHAIGMMTNSDDVAARLTRAGEATHERVWRMPVWDVYTEQIKSDVADIKNTGGRAGGSLTAAAFLKEFVGDYPWAHLDIAGTAYTDRPARAYGSKGATGVGVRLLTQMLVDWAERR